MRQNIIRVVHIKNILFELVCAASLKDIFKLDICFQHIKQNTTWSLHEKFVFGFAPSILIGMPHVRPILGESCGHHPKINSEVYQWLPSALMQSLEKTEIQG